MKVTEKEFNEAYMIVRKYKEQILETYKGLNAGIGAVNKKTDLVKDSNISARTKNVLKNIVTEKEYLDVAINPHEYWRVFTLRDLSVISVMELSRKRNCGKNSINEVKELAVSAGVTLKK